MAGTNITVSQVFTISTTKNGATYERHLVEQMESKP